MLKTIQLPKNLKHLSKKLPKATYDSLTTEPVGNTAKKETNSKATLEIANQDSHEKLAKKKPDHPPEEPEQLEPTTRRRRKPVDAPVTDRQPTGTRQDPSDPRLNIKSRMQSALNNDSRINDRITDRIDSSRPSAHELLIKETPIKDREMLIRQPTASQSPEKL